MQRLIEADALKETICSHLYPVVDYFNSKDYGMFWTGGIEKAIDEQPTIDAVPIEFIEKRIAELKKLNEYEFIANGGYTSPSYYAQWELERLIRDWREQNAKTD